MRVWNISVSSTVLDSSCGVIAFEKSKVETVTFKYGGQTAFLEDGGVRRLRADPFLGTRIVNVLEKVPCLFTFFS